MKLASNLKRFFRILKVSIRKRLFPSTDRNSEVFRFNIRVGGLIKEILLAKELDVYRMQFTKIAAKEFKDRIDIKVSLCRPGFFIGKGGSVINAVEAQLTEYFEKPVKIYIEESFLW